MLIFIDESGDPGFKMEKGSTAAFIAALVAFKDHSVARKTQATIDALATRLRIQPEFKFSKCRDEVRDAFFSAVKPHDFCVRDSCTKRTNLQSTSEDRKRGVLFVLREDNAQVR
jgi:hypothetical protein